MARGGGEVSRRITAALALWLASTAAGCAAWPGHGGLPADEQCAIEDVAPAEANVEAIGAREYVVAVKKKAWEASLGGEEAAKPYVRARLRGWPARQLVDPASLPGDDAQFAARLARDAWRGIDAFTDREHGLPIDNVRFADDSVAPADAAVGDYTSATNIGLYLMAVVGARDLGFLSPAEAVDRLRATLHTLQGLESHAGFFFNYYDTTSLERTSNLLSFVDSSWLTAGLMVARQAVPEIAAECTALIDRADYGFFYDASKRFMSHGYYVHRAARSLFHYGVLYTESRLGSVIAIGKGDVPEAHWFAMLRTFPAACTWQSRAPVGRAEKTVRGHAMRGGWYEWNGLRYVPSWGGSMFEALMPALVFDEPRYAPRSLGLNDIVHALVQQRFARDELQYPVWGLSPSTIPGRTVYGEYGVKVLGTHGYAPGAVTPHASALALAVSPTAAAANLRQLAERYPLYGEYGLYDAVDPISGKVAHAYMALDQLMLFIALANHLGDHCIQNHFAADPITQRALPVIGAEDFFN